LKRVAIFVFVCLAANVHAARFLFDADHAQSGNNADWVIDADVHNITWLSSGTFTTSSGNESNAQRIPTPPASGITAGTAETYWSGAISAWAVDLVKRGHSVETLPAGTTFTYSTSNTQDLTNYDVVIIDEPDILFATSEKQALLNFVANGGGLFMISDHVGAVRTQGTGGIDAVTVWTDFLTNNGLTNNPFGIVFRMTGTGSNSSGNNTFYHNIVGDPILNGPVGMATNMAYFNGNEFQIDNTMNPTAISRMWFGLSSDSNNFCGLASLQYGNGRVVVCGDSSCIDDGTGDPNDTSLFDGYTTGAGGVQHIWILNASEWLAAPFAASPVLVGVTNVTPSCGSTAGGMSVTITGSNFVSGATVTIGGLAATSVVIVNSNTVTASTPANTAGAKIVQVTNTSGKFGALTNAFTYVVPPSPSDNGPICSGQTLNLFANTNAASYSWSGPNGFTSTAQNPSIANVTAAAAGKYVLSVGCSSATGATSVVVNALPTSRTVTGGGSFCSGGSGVAVGLNGSDSGVKYQLVRNSSTNVGSPVTGTGSAITFGNQTVAGTYTVVASNVTTSCTLAMSGSATVTVNPLPTVTTTPSGSTNICNGGSVTLTAAGASTYGWSPATGLSTTTGATVQASPSSTTIYTVTGTDANGCQNSASVTVTVNPVPTCTVSPAIAAICVGGSQTFTANPSGGTGPYTYSWTGPNGHSAAASSITISNAQTADAGSYMVMVTDANGCASSCSAPLMDFASGPTSAPAITTPGAGFCVNAANVGAFTVAGTADSNILVQVFANAVLVGATIADGSGNWSTNLDFTAQAEGLISLTAVATNACSSTPSSPLGGMKDVTAPSFTGLDTVVPVIEGATLTWSVAVDSNAVTYEVFETTTGGGENFGAPTLTTNGLSAFITPLYPGSNSPITYFFVVRAMDGCGNTDTNTVEKSLQPLLDPNKDQDGDGMPNGFEQAHGLNPFDASDANLDSDGDGISNLQEFLAGTDPTNAASSFRITSILRAGSDILVSWMMGSGKTNALQWTTGAGNGSYQTNNFADLFIVTNTIDSTTNYLDGGGATNLPSRYYRIRLVP
jgi:hypothetical protein